MARRSLWRAHRRWSTLSASKRLPFGSPAVSATPVREATRAGLEEQAAEGTRSLGIPFYPTAITGTFDEFFEQGQVLNLFIEVEDRVPTYTIDSSGNVIEVGELSEQMPTLRLVLRQDKEGQWRVEQIVIDN